MDEDRVPQPPMTFVVPNEVPATIEQLSNHVPTAQHGAIACELAAGILTVPQIAETFKVSVAAVLALQANPIIAAEVAHLKKEFAKDPSGGFHRRMRALAEAALPGMYRILADDKIAAGTRTALFAQFVEYAKLSQGKGGKEGGQVNVQFNFTSGIRGVSDGEMKIINP